jgi:hypothetical protein
MKDAFNRITLLCMLACPLPSWALDSDPKPPAPPAFNAWYWGIGFDMTNFSTNRNGVLAAFPALTTNTSIQSNSSNLRLFAGYEFDEFLGAQFDWSGLGSVRGTDGGVSRQLFDPDLISFSAVLNQPVSDKLKLFGKLGGTYWGLRKAGAAQNDPAMNSGFGPNLGIGLDLNLYGGSERMIRLEWNYYKMDGVILNNANSLSLNALFRF